jgi:hypothetical protein
MSVKAIAMETWKASTSSDRPDGSRNVVGKLIFHSLTINECVELRKAAAKGKNLKAATAFAKSSPI